MDYWFVWDLANSLNIIWEYLKDSKDVIIALLAVIFTIYIPFLLYFYQEINWKDKFKYLDLHIFHNDVFVLKKVFWSIIFLLILLLSWNSWNSSNNYWWNIEILLLSIFPFWFLINNLFKLYELNENLREEKKSKIIFEIRINAIKKLKINQNNYYLFKDILQNKNLEDYNFTVEFFKIFFEKIHWEINKHKKWDWETEQLMRNLLFSYKKLEDNSHTLNSFNYQDFILLLNIYKADNQNKNSHLSGDIMKTIISKIEKISWDTYRVVHHLQKFLEKENDNFRFKFLSHFHSSIFNSKIILEDRDFMEKYWIDIFDKYKSLKWNIAKTTTNIKIKLYQKLVQIIQFHQWDYNYWYDNILRFWLLEYEAILFTRLMYLYFATFWENRAISILEHKIVFGWIWRVKTYLWDWEKDLEAENAAEEEKTIQLFVKEFWWNKQVLENLKIQFQEIMNENKREESDIRKSKYHIWLINKLIEEWEKLKSKKHEK